MRYKVGVPSKQNSKEWEKNYRLGDLYGMAASSMLRERNKLTSGLPADVDAVVVNPQQLRGVLWQSPCGHPNELLSSPRTLLASGLIA